MCANDGNWYRNRLLETPQLACFAVEDGIVAVFDPVADVDVGGDIVGSADWYAVGSADNTVAVVCLFLRPQWVDTL